MCTLTWRVRYANPSSLTWRSATLHSLYHWHSPCFSLAETKLQLRHCVQRHWQSSMVVKLSLAVSGQLPLALLKQSPGRLGV